MTSKVLNLLLLGVVLAVAIACGSDSDSTSTETVSIPVTIDETNQKPRSGATLTNLTLFVVNTDNTVQRSIEVTGASLTVNVNKGSNCYLELRFTGSDTVYLSKFLSSSETANDITSGAAAIDAVSHYIATEVKDLITTNTSAADVLSAFNSFIAATFTSYSATSSMAVLLVESNVKVSGLRGQLVALANRIANNVITVTNVTVLITDFVEDVAEGTNDTVTFSAPTLSANAAPGVVYAFNPGATSSADELAATPYVVSVTSGAGSVAVDSDNGLVKYIPDAADINSTVTLSVNAIGVLGGSNVQSVSFAVTDLEIAGKDEYRLGGSGSAPYQLVEGPLVDGDNLYVVANKNGTVTIEKYTLADFAVATTGSPSAAYVTLRGSNWVIPGAFSDILIKNDVAYVVDSNTGVVKYDLTNANATGFSSTTTTNFTASTLAVVGTKLLAFNSQNQTFASLDTSSSSADVASVISSLNDSSLTASDVGSFGSYFYVSGANSSQIATVEFYDSSFNFVDSFTSLYGYDFIEDASGLSDTLYGVSAYTSTVVALTFSGSEIVASTFTTSTAGTVANSEFYINGSTLVTNNFSDTAYGYSLTSGNVASSTEENTSTFDITYDITDLSAVIVNIPEGASTLDTAGETSNTTHFFVPAKQNTTSLTSSYYIKAYELTAED